MKILLSMVFAICTLTISTAQEPDTTVYKVVEEMPRFPGCEEEENLTLQEMKKCADTNLLAFIEINTVYPEEALKMGIQGRVFVTFIVEKDGTLSNLELVRDIGGGCGEAGLQVIKLMQELDIKWRPGRQNGEIVRVRFNLPVHFKL